jgi:hypothetical protein
MDVLHRKYIVRHFFVRVGVYQCLYHLQFQVSRKNNLYLGFFFLVLLAYFAHMRVRAFFRFERTFSNAVEATFRILADMTCPAANTACRTASAWHAAQT